MASPPGPIFGRPEDRLREPGEVGGWVGADGRKSPTGLYKPHLTPTLSSPTGRRGRKRCATLYRR